MKTYRFSFFFLLWSANSCQKHTRQYSEWHGNERNSLAGQTMLNYIYQTSPPSQPPQYKLPPPCILNNQQAPSIPSRPLSCHLPKRQKPRTSGNPRLGLGRIQIQPGPIPDHLLTIDRLTTVILRLHATPDRRGERIPRLLEYCRTRTRSQSARRLHPGRSTRD